jgi:hypothetical protein
MSEESRESEGDLLSVRVKSKRAPAKETVVVTKGKG